MDLRLVEGMKCAVSTSSNAEFCCVALFRVDVPEVEGLDFSMAQQQSIAPNAVITALRRFVQDHNRQLDISRQSSTLCFSCVFCFSVCFSLFVSVCFAAQQRLLKVRCLCVLQRRRAHR